MGAAQRIHVQRSFARRDPAVADVACRNDLVGASSVARPVPDGAADRILFDAPAAALPGGTGARFDWSLLRNHRHSIDWGIAGGLTPANVGQAIAETGAPLVDVSSGVESAPGVKDVDKIAAFLKAAGR